MTTPEDRIYGLLVSYGINLIDEGRTAKSLTTQIEALITLHTQKAEQEILDALYWMYNQYCSNRGHDFMGAGEVASDILERRGYIEVDGTGRVTKDNTDIYGTLTNPTEAGEK